MLQILLAKRKPLTSPTRFQISQSSSANKQHCFTVIW